MRVRATEQESRHAALFSGLAEIESMSRLIRTSDQPPGRCGQRTASCRSLRCTMGMLPMRASGLHHGEQRYHSEGIAALNSPAACWRGSSESVKAARGCPIPTNRRGTKSTTSSFSFKSTRAFKENVAVLQHLNRIPHSIHGCRLVALRNVRHRTLWTAGRVAVTIVDLKELRLVRNE